MKTIKTILIALMFLLITGCDYLDAYISDDYIYIDYGTGYFSSGGSGYSGGDYDDFGNNDNDDEWYEEAWDTFEDVGPVFSLFGFLL